MGTNFFSIETMYGANVATRGNYADAQAAAVWTLRKRGELQVIERDSEWGFVALRGIANEGRYVELKP